MKNVVISLYRITLKELKIKRLNDKNRIKNKIKQQIRLNTKLTGKHKELAIDGLIRVIKLL